MSNKTRSFFHGHLAIGEMGGCYYVGGAKLDTSELAVAHRITVSVQGVTDGGLTKTVTVTEELGRVELIEPEYEDEASS